MAGENAGAPRPAFAKATAGWQKGGYTKTDLENPRVEKPNVKSASRLDSMRSFLKWID
jgi:hypothetical protein